MKMSIAFQKATHADRDFLLALRKASMTEHLSAAGLALSDEQHFERIDEFFAESHLILLNEQAIGVLKLGVLQDRLHIRQLQILPKFHNRGIGTNVIELIKRKATERSLPITLNVLLANPAKKLYQRAGFVVEGENELEYQMRWQA